ncbi:U4 U6.U5 tri-snRNP-associated protein [Spiromyces aspiralis]|uniref:U4 U6.U5 tri-snRNP-associated protein n=1 Tax=Spiromyces aspiralis TaxID=68401 RepID=A0ACC1HI19_9FUNG|nr:U4 U6.U5 tri-snRNP-associated protein [Spiromyces aspiralis]
MGSSKRRRTEAGVERVQAEYYDDSDVNLDMFKRKPVAIAAEPDTQSLQVRPEHASGSPDGQRDPADVEGDDNDDTDGDNTFTTDEAGQSASKDLYLDTVNRSLLDFDFEKLCSPSVDAKRARRTGFNIGRGRNTHAYFHSIDSDHHVFINLKSLKIYILPEQYEVTDPSLNDIKAVIWPTFDKRQVAELDQKLVESYDLKRKKYIPGFGGLNNIKANDYMNVVIQALAHIPPIRDKMLLTSLPEKSSELVQRLSLLVRKMWFPRAFKGHVSPHEFVQEVVNRSNRRFRIDVQGDAFEFLTWLLNTLHIDLGGTRKPGSRRQPILTTKPIRLFTLGGRLSHPLRYVGIIHKTFQGEVRVETQDISLIKSRASKEDPAEIDESNKITTQTGTFLTLTLDLPPPPLFQDEKDNIVPQVALVTLLKTYDGSTAVERLNEAKRYQLLRLPKYVILHMRRFKKNNFNVEKNPTIVNFPIRDVPLGELVPEDELRKSGMKPARYNLVVNISHQGQPPLDASASDRERQSAAMAATAIATSSDANMSGATGGQPTKARTTTRTAGSYMIHVRHSGTDQWFQIQDLLIEPIMPQMIALSESYIQIWERNDGQR